MDSNFVIPKDGNASFTDYSRWRLEADDGGRHTWHYLKSDTELREWPQSSLDKYWLGLDTGLPDLPPAKNALDSARNGFQFYRHLQASGGHWPGEYGGPMFPLGGLVIGSYVSGMSFEEEERREMIRYLFNLAHPKDGGWGLHIEGDSTVFGLVLNYVSLRLLGVPPDHPVTTRARATLHKLGGACAAPAWGKFWLSVLNVYEWEGNNSIPPELWILPEWLPLHPHRWWIHVRNVFTPMSYLYGVRFKAPENALILALRQELYTENYDEIDWPAQRNNVAHAEVYTPHSTLMNAVYSIFSVYESCNIPPIRQMALRRVYDLIVMEDENTGYQTLGPVSKMINLICRTHVEGIGSDAWKLHAEKRRDFMWMSKEGMMMCGTNGSQLWDVSFISQALVESGLANEDFVKPHALRALQWLERAQLTENPKHYDTAYRQASKGAWPFSTKEQSYTVSDCTGEGLKSVIYYQKLLDYTPELVSERRLCDAVDVMISLQNSSGGFASYEPIRGPQWLELLNASEVFGNIMIEYDYPECTTSVITSLAVFQKHYPNYRQDKIKEILRGAVRYLHSAQTKEGLWYGCWGICFTYATMFALESLSLVGETYATSLRVRKACDYLVSKQRQDGGWGESYKACVEMTWVEHEKTQVTQTSWATIALMHARYPHRDVIERAVRLVMSRQLPNGSWAQEAIEGMFNKTCAISYPNFKFSFTIWMLGKAHTYLKNLGKSDIPNINGKNH